MSTEALRHSRALWNRDRLDLGSDEVLAQLLDRGEMAAWRELYSLCRDDDALRRRVLRIVLAVPMPLPRFWLAALVSLGESIDLAAALPPYPAEAEL
jgi:hypothetical protein